MKMPVQLFVGNKPVPKLLKKPKNSVWGIGIKPESGGLWTSSFVGGSSGWVNWCIAESFRSSKFKAWLLEPKDANIITIEDVDDLIAMKKKYPSVLGGEKDPLLGIGSHWRDTLNFELMYDSGVDGIHLTEEGQWKTRFSHPGLYGWDCECTLWPSKRLGVAIPAEDGMVWE